MKIELLSHWDNILAVFPKKSKDVYFAEEYVRLYENDKEKARCLFCKDGENEFLLPILLREFHFAGEVYFDFETAYGYGGSVCNTKDEAFITAAWKAVFDFCAKENFVAGFFRFHPLLQNQVGFDGVGRLIADRKTVAINLNQTMDEVWSNEIHSKNRNVIRKAEKAGCHFIVDDQYDHLDDFQRLYAATMDKLSADLFYYFPDDYYRRLRDTVENSFLGCVEHEGKIISAAIFMYNGEWGHYHLSGSDRSYLSLSPNNFMLWEAAKELQNRGVKLFHLGGGTNGDEDNSLYLFKRRFSKETLQFYIGKQVFNSAVYEAVCKEWEQRNPDKAEQFKNITLKYKY